MKWKWNNSTWTFSDFFHLHCINKSFCKIITDLRNTFFHKKFDFLQKVRFFTKSWIFYKKFDFFFEFWAKLSKGVKTFFNILPQNYFGNEIQSTWIEFSIRYAIWDCNTLPINNELTERISNTKRGIQAGYLYIEKRAI